MKRILLATLIVMSLITNQVLAMENVELSDGSNYSEEVDENTFKYQFKKIVDGMEKTLRILPVVENVNINFLNQMITLHSEEIQLSISIEGYTDNAQVIEYANRIIADENGELREMRLVLKDLKNDINKASKGNNEYINEFKELSKIRFSVLNDYEVTDKPERDYLNIMSLNNLSDIKLAKVYLKYSDNEVVKKIAQNIIQVKESQLKDAEKLLESF